MEIKNFQQINYCCNCLIINKKGTKLVPFYLLSMLFRKLGKISRLFYDAFRNCNMSAMLRLSLILAESAI